MYFKIKDKVTIPQILENATNVAKILGEEDLDNIGRYVKEGYKADETTRSGWVDQQEQTCSSSL